MALLFYKIEKAHNKIKPLTLTPTYSEAACYLTHSSVESTPPIENACSQKSGNIANIRTSRQGAKNLQFLSGFNF